MTRRRPLALALSLLLVATARADDAIKPRFSPTQRMAPAHLEKTHSDVSRLKAARKTLPTRPGLTDFRAILHAHAEDSAHTGGTRPEMLAEAKKAGVNAIFLSNHHRPPTDFMTDSWRGLHDGVLFIPGSEDRGFLLAPMRSIAGNMKDSTADLIKAATADGGLIWLSHIEERPGHSMEGLSGMEIYNRHADAKKDTAGLLGLVLKLTDPKGVAELEKSLALYPDELFASQVEYPADYLAKWDKETQTRRLSGVAANDCHHHQILLVKMVDATTVLVGTNVDKDEDMRKLTATLRPGIRQLTRGRKPGDVLIKLDLDPYHRSFQNVSTHIFAKELTEPAVRSALREGHAYVSHDWICDPTGFFFEADGGAKKAGAGSSKGPTHAIMGDEIKMTPGLKLVAEFPLHCHIRLLRAGTVRAEVDAERIIFDVKEPGVYRVEAWVELVGEKRPWIYSNPIYIHDSGI